MSDLAQRYLFLAKKVRLVDKVAMFSAETEDIAATGCYANILLTRVSSLTVISYVKRKPFTISPNMYKEYLAEFWYSAKALENSKVFFSIPTGGIFREVRVNTFRNSIGVHYLPHSSEYAAPSSIDVFRQWFPMIGYEEVVLAKGTLIKSLIPPRWRVTGEARANPQLSSGMSAFNLNEPIYSASLIIHYESASENDASIASTAKVNPGNFAPSYFIPQNREETSNTTKLEDLAKLVSHVLPSFKDLDSPKDDHVIVVNDSDEDEDDEVHATENVELKILQFLNPYLPGLLKFKSLPTKYSFFSLKTQRATEIELPGDLKEIPPKLKDFTKTVTSLTSQAKLKTLDALLSLFNKVTNALNQFAQAITSKKTGGDSVPSASQAGTQPAEGRRTQIKPQS
nr:hypothetical protein [Tanacetum cinerariifolium]